VTLALILALQATGLGRSLGGDSSVAIGLQITKTGLASSALALRGRSVDRERPGTFGVSTDVSQLPCPGQYLFHADTENDSNGNSSSFDALLRLYDPSSQPTEAGCGIAPPPLPGRLSVLLQGAKTRLFSVKGGRSNAGAFEGGLLFASTPECNQRYTLEAALDLAGWSRYAKFKAETLWYRTTLQGEKPSGERC
jgi:hypothetical protein